MSDKQTTMKKQKSELDPSWADRAVDRIIKEMSDRKGIGDEWEHIDEEIQQEIKEAWADIIRGAAFDHVVSLAK